MDAMIVVLHEERLEVVTQNDHARLSGQILELLPELADHPRRDALLIAAHRHDSGWQEEDSAPSVDDDGAPHDFLSLPTRRRLEIWRRGTERCLEQDGYAGLLVILHAARLFEESLQRSPDPDVAEELRRLGDRRDELLEELEVSPQEASEDYRWLDLVDLLSLVACNRWPGPFRKVLPRDREIQITWQGDSLRLDPFLLAGDTTFSVPQRRVEPKTFATSTDFAMTLAASSWEQRRLTLRPIAPR